MKVDINRDRDGWRFDGEGMRSDPFPTYPAVVRAAIAAGHQIDAAGWRHKLLIWNWHNHAIDGCPEWEIENPNEPDQYQRHPAFVKLEHKRGKGKVESSELCNAWDDIAEADFYHRDWTEDALPFVREGETYWSGWWFATIAERDRFVKWQNERRGLVTRVIAAGRELFGV